MRSELVLAINQLCAERKLSPEVVMEAVEASLISAYKRNFGAATNIEVHMNPDTGDVRVFAAKEVVETVSDRKTQISLGEAQAISPELQLGETVLIESTPRDFGRIAAQTAKQVILQRIREAERDALYSSFADSAGEIAHGTIQSLDYHSNDVIINIDGAEALLPAREQVASERYRRGQRLRAYVLDVRKGSRGPQITLSRRSPALLRRLLELEVPEIFNGSVEIKAIAREPGSRSKVAVHATQEGVDPVGSCVGVRGGRIQNVVNELAGEKIDVVQWDSDVGTFIANSLSPAKVMNVLLDDSPESGKTATVIVPDRQLSLAIGKEGQNARLAAKLTGWRIDIKSATEAAEETLGRLEDIKIAPEDMDLLTLAESLLRTPGGAGLSVEQRELVHAAVEDLEGVLVLEEEAGPESTERAGAETEPKSGPESEGDELGEMVELGAPDLDEEVPELEPVLAEGEVAGEVSAPSFDRGDEELTFRDREEDEIPPFDGELVSDSIGWVQVESQEDYYSGWTVGDELEADLEDVEFEWVQDEVEEPDEEEHGKGKKKKGKRRSKADRFPDFEENADARRGKKRGRPGW